MIIWNKFYFFLVRSISMFFLTAALIEGIAQICMAMLNKINAVSMEFVKHSAFC